MTRSRIAGVGSIALGVGIAASALLGPLFPKIIDFRTSAHLENQFVGGEIISLAVVAPTAIGQEYARYDGNVERFFPLYAGLALVTGRLLRSYVGNVDSDQIRHGMRTATFPRTDAA